MSNLLAFVVLKLNVKAIFNSNFHLQRELIFIIMVKWRLEMGLIIRVLDRRNANDKSEPNNNSRNAPKPYSLPNPLKQLLVTLKEFRGM